MRSRRGLGREKHRFVATYRLHVFRFSLFWQDMRAMHPKSPAERRWGIHRANILPPRGAFAVRSPQTMHGARILPPPLMDLPLRRGSCPSSCIAGSPFNGLALAQGCLPRRPADTRHLPIPATRCTHYSQRQAADELRRRSSGAWPAVRPSPEGPPTAPSRRAGRQRSAAQSWA